MKEKKLELKHALAYYLPQYHEVKENNEWWGKGFTEWTNVGDAIAYSKKQVIRKPSQLGYYTLDNASIIEKQYKIARKAGIDTFCFWHYWFDDNDLLLEKPAEKLLNSDASVEFCFAWANHSWYNKTKGILLKEQKYDYSLAKHFNYLIKFFLDPRYRKIDNKPVLVVYNSKHCQNFREMKVYFEREIKNYGLDGIYFILENTNSEQFSQIGGDAYLNSCRFLKFRSFSRKIFDKILYQMDIRLKIKTPRFYNYIDCVKQLNNHIDPYSKEMPIVFPGWDSTIRHKKGGVCLIGSNPNSFGSHLENVAEILIERDVDDRVLMVKSWNEWAEGNFMEPCDLYEDAFLFEFSKRFFINEKL
ncbi:glycoside hydrolase family 99-like domain-containing protein [Vibrio splendidus]|uniref:glycosyltransferase WbsX family protein n=1 Tax=Vibrio splendidus TaxID=29497 RepID=UPI00352C339C